MAKKSLSVAEVKATLSERIREVEQRGDGCELRQDHEPGERRRNRPAGAAAEMRA